MYRDLQMAYIKPHSIPYKAFACGICKGHCEEMRTFCGSCARRFHSHCQNISKEQQQGLEELPPDVEYICRQCRSDAQGFFDFEKALQRLRKAAVQGISKLQLCAKRELLFFEPFESLQGCGSLEVDIYSKDLLAVFMAHDQGIPTCNVADGNALFRAVSIAVSAQDLMMTELRVRACIEMVAYQSFHRWQKNHAALAICAPDYHDSCLDCAFCEKGASVWTMSALASVINRPIMSVYPRVNGSVDQAAEALNTVFVPRDCRNCEQPIRIMWTRNQADTEQGSWVPDHFVPLFDQEPLVQSVLEDKGEKRKTDFSKNPLVVASESPPLLTEDAFEMEIESIITAEGGQPLEHEKFMTVFECYDKVTSATHVLDSIPKGRKENVYFLIDNSYNMQNPQKRNLFFDDCGVWDAQRGTCVKTHYILQENGELRTCKKYKGIFCQLKANKLDKTWMPLEKQPGPDEIVECFRYYTLLKRDLSYKRRYTWFKFPPQVKAGNVALVEYVGTYPGPPALHGNAKKQKQGYVRTDPRVMDRIAEQVRIEDVTPGKLFEDICKTMGGKNTMRNPRQISNLKYRVKRKLQKEEVEPCKTSKSLQTSETQPERSSNVSHFEGGVNRVMTTSKGAESNEKLFTFPQSTDLSQMPRVLYLVEDSVLVKQEHPLLEDSQSAASSPVQHKIVLVNGESGLSLVTSFQDQEVLRTDADEETVVVNDVSAKAEVIPQ